MYVVRRMFALGVVAGLALVLVQANAGEKKEVIPEKAKADLKTDAVRLTDMAFGLIGFGREYNAPEALILAAKILGTVKYENGDVDKDGDDPKTQAKKLINEALKKAPDNEAIKALADAASKEIADEKTRATLHGRPVRHFFVLQGDELRRFKVNLVGGQGAVITALNETQADVDIYVHNEAGNIVARDRSPASNAHVTFVPRVTQQFTVVVHNYSKKKVARVTVVAN